MVANKKMEIKCTEGKDRSKNTVIFGIGNYI